MYNAEQRQHVRHNFIVNVTDGSLFGLGLGISSYITIVPLFIATLTDSTVLIGLIATIHTLGWQLPQLLTSGRVSRVRRYLPLTLWMTLNERVPLVLMMMVALVIPYVSRDVALILAFVTFCWVSLGGGLTATAWQSLIAKILPARVRGTFYGIQSGGSNFLGSLGALTAGTILVTVPYPANFAVCFGLAFVAKMISWIFLAQTIEGEHEPAPSQQRTWQESVDAMRALLRADRNFVWFLGARMLGQFAQMALSFYTIYAVRRFGMDAQTAGVLTSMMTFTQMIGNPLLGYLGDRWGHRLMLVVGSLAMAGSAFLALSAPSVTWFYGAFILAGIAGSSQWTSILAFSSEFGTEQNRPYYVGMINTLVAPATLLSPIVGGVLADSFGFSVTFAVAIVAGITTAGVLLVWVQNPQPLKRKAMPKNA
jgi:MFS family permease